VPDGDAVGVGDRHAQLGPGAADRGGGQFAA
jgi:hypothetical protein